MSLEDIETVLNQLERFLKVQDGRSLPDGQRAVLHGLLIQPSWKYEQLATELERLGLGRYKPHTLKNDAYKVFQRLTIAFQSDSKIKKTNLQRNILAWYRTQGPSPAPPDGPPPPTTTLETPGNLLPLESWTPDLNHLVEQVRTGRRLVGIGGPPRIGKTYFTYSLCDRLAPLFEAPPLWCLAAHVPTPDALYQAILHHLGESPQPRDTLPRLLELFRSRRLLIIIDGTEILHQPHRLAGTFQATAALYDTWLRQLLEVPVHQSCLIWVGRELPAWFTYSHGMLVVHRVRHLQDRDALRLLKTHPIALADEPRGRLLDFCGGNPAWLLMAVTRIQQLYRGDVDAFLASPALPEDVLETLTQTLERLSRAEWLLLVWLLLQPLSPDQLLHFHVPSLSLHEQREALLSLQGRGLLCQNDGNPCYGINPPLLRWGLFRHIGTRVETAITDGTLDHLRHFPLVNRAAPAPWQTWQQQQLLEAIAQRLRQRYAFRQEQVTCLQQCLLPVRQMPAQEQGYAAGNLFNLAIALNLPLAELDWNGLEIYHADFRTIQRNPLMLEGCTLQHPLLPVALGDRPLAAISPDGNLIAAGDQAGHVLCWRQEDATIRLHGFWQADTAIELMLCPDGDTLWFVAGQRLYTWWVDDDPRPRSVLELSEPASCLAQSALGQVAIGLSHGPILLWDGSSQPTRTLQAHQSEICNLAFSSDGLRLASMDQDNHVLEWRLPMHPDEQPTWQELPTHTALCLAVEWDGDTLLRVETRPYQLCLWLGEADFQEQAIDDRTIHTLQFSANGRYLVGRTDGDRIFHWDRQGDTFTLLPPGAIAHNGDLALTADGRSLLVTTPHYLQWFDLCQQTTLWQVDTTQDQWTGTRFRQVKGISPIEQVMLTALGMQWGDG